MCRWAALPPLTYHVPLGSPKPSWGNWQLREVDVVDIRRVRGSRRVTSGYPSPSRLDVCRSLGCGKMRTTRKCIYRKLPYWLSIESMNKRLEEFLGYLLRRPVWTVSVKSDHSTNASTQSKDDHDVLIESRGFRALQELCRVLDPRGPRADYEVEQMTAPLMRGWIGHEGCTCTSF